MASLDWAADCHASGTVKRAALAAKNNLEPIRGHVAATGVGTESTGLHHALEG